MRFLTDEKGVVVLVGSDITAVKVSDGELVSCTDNDNALFGYMYGNTAYQKEMFALHEDDSAPDDLAAQGYTYTDRAFAKLVATGSEPTLEERNRADIDYIALMTGVTL